MRPIFTIHAGEYLVGTRIEESFPKLRVWVPSKDRGIDLLVTDENSRKLTSLQVKFSKDYLATSARSFATSAIQSGGWWTLNRDKLRDSPADLWVMVLYQFHTRMFGFVVIPPQRLLARYDKLRARSQAIQSYIWVSIEGRCWETRGLKAAEQKKVCEGDFEDPTRDLTKYLNAWPF